LQKDDIHRSHCSHCFSTACSSPLCPLSECDHCYARMHECKLEDHKEICPLEMITCLNSTFGCPLSLRRDFLSRHLSFCPASVIMCSHERARAAVDKPSKKMLKSAGKNRREKEYDCPRLIIEAYTYSREDRTRRRDRINIRDPQLPLRPIVDGSSEEGFTTSQPLPSQDEAVDSSEDERKIEEARIKKLRGIFADCYMCQVDPSVQHFHTLGRSDVRWDQLMYQRSRRSWYEQDPFYAERRLLVSMHVEKVPEAARRSDNILKLHRSGTLYTRRCLAAAPRSAVDAHHASQHVTGGDVDLESLIVRCPLWWRGCRFHSARVRPRGGQIRFIQELGAFAFKPDVFPSPPPPSDSSPLLDAPSWMLAEIARFLSGVALASLSATCTQMRNSLFSNVAIHRGVVSLRWSKTDRSRWTSSPIWSFPLTESTPPMDPGPSPDLSQHIGSCPYNEPCPLPSFAEESPLIPGAVSCLPGEVREIMN
ncbi:hypothetical protein PMAYCL1PPCAC_04124, partial [Pristionchus mayeri]